MGKEWNSSDHRSWDGGSLDIDITDDLSLFHLDHTGSSCTIDGRYTHSISSRLHAVLI